MATSTATRLDESSATESSSSDADVVLHDSDPGGTASHVAVGLADVPTKAQLRQRERRSRERRKEKFAAMHQQVKALECAVANVMFVRDHVDEWEELLDEDSKRMRRFLRASAQLKDKLEKAQAEKVELRRLLREYEINLSALRLAIRDEEIDMDDWSLDTLRWRAITHAHFMPWTREQCDDVIEAACKHIQTFALRDDLVTTGICFNGWRDRRRLDVNSSMIQFSFYKDFASRNIRQAADIYWNVFLSSAEYARVQLGPNVKVYYEVIQGVTPNIQIVRCVEQYPGMYVKIHMLFLLFRLWVDGSYLQVIKTIPVQEIQLATADEDAAWASTFHWVQFDVLQRDKQGECAAFRITASGSMSSENPDYVRRWMVEAMMTVMRSEMATQGSRFLTTG
ncbi:hypothetical protein Poli38472_006764 [Pythium oligandrum]|uniref:Uncharacterized protein n=1 Tax=Pythium oligandrum TaxID=41045 RepID=A0A8K1C560_PYTOL|nr:hypothetical protein Poli38472_006764 [Pythium oligandrum]|eukprot:TMW56754.1 hypothetical protein Poli38472_006764 [Pythium oligandrum]